LQIIRSTVNKEGVLEYVPKSEIDGRIACLQGQLGAAGLDGAFIVQTADLYYFTGTIQNAVLYVPVSGAPVLAVRMSYERAKRESPLKNIAPMRSYRELPEILGFTSPPGKVGMELDVLPVSAHSKLSKSIGAPETVDISMAVRGIRAVKSPYEVGQIEGAAEIHRQVFSLVPSMMKEGMTELDLATRMDAEYGARGHSGPIRVRAWNQEFYAGVVSAGVSANAPTAFDGPDGMDGPSPATHQMAGSRVIVAGEPVIVDFVCIHNGYLADKTRIFCIGRPSEEAAEAHELAVQMQKEIAAELRPGAIPEDIYNDAKAIADESPWGNVFMGYGDNQVSFVGHGVGLELDELPVLASRFREPLVEGMTIAVEPKFFLEGVGAVGIEDTFVVERNGGRKITEFPTEIQVV
jgi:Xaa-Pro aminopeptidase